MIHNQLITRRELVDELINRMYKTEYKGFKEKYTLILMTMNEDEFLNMLEFKFKRIRKNLYYF